MRKIFSVIVLALALALVVSAQEMITNKNVVEMVKSGLPESTILTVIKVSETKFDLGIADAGSLAKSGVNERIIAAMLDKQTPKIAPAPVQAELPPPPVNAFAAKVVSSPVYYPPARPLSEGERTGIVPERFSFLVRVEKINGSSITVSAAQDVIVRRMVGAGGILLVKAGTISNGIIKGPHFRCDSGIALQMPITIPNERMDMCLDQRDVSIGGDYKIRIHYPLRLVWDEEALPSVLRQ